MKPLKFLSIGTALLLMLNMGCDCPKCPDAAAMPLMDSNNTKTKSKKLPVEHYAAEMIANYHQNLTLEQYRSVKMWTVSIDDMQALIDLAKKRGKTDIRIFMGAPTQHMMSMLPDADADATDGTTATANEGDATDDGKSDDKCTLWADVPLPIFGIDEDVDGIVVQTEKICMRYCPPPNSCGDTARIEQQYIDGELATESLNKIAAHKFKYKAIQKIKK